MCYEMGKGGNSTMSLIFKDHSLKEIFNDVVSETNHKQHEKMKPPLVRKRNTEDLRPEAVCSDHRVSLLLLS